MSKISRLIGPLIHHDAIYIPASTRLLSQMPFYDSFCIHVVLSFDQDDQDGMFGRTIVSKSIL